MIYIKLILGKLYIIWVTVTKLSEYSGSASSFLSSVFEIGALVVDCTSSGSAQSFIRCVTVFLCTFVSQLYPISTVELYERQNIGLVESLTQVLHVQLET